MNGFSFFQIQVQSKNLISKFNSNPNPTNSQVQNQNPV